MSCDHYLGVLGSEVDLYISNFSDEIKYASEYQFRLYESGYYESYNTEKEIMDFRRGYLQAFNYCPLCGDKINWKEIKDGVIKGG